MTQIVADILTVPRDWVRYSLVDTDSVPFDQDTNASSAIAVMGQAVERAANDVRLQISKFAADKLGCEPDNVVLRNWVAFLDDQPHPLQPMIVETFGGTGFEFIGTGFFKALNDARAPLGSPCVFWEIGWGGAEVEVDRETGQVRLLRLIISGDAGRMINPQLCRGQDEGAATMALGQTLFEQLVYADGRLATSDPLTYRVPLSTDIPDVFDLVIQEQGHGPGPSGSKGFGEGGMLVVASAVANAIEDAVGVRITDLPITPERVLEALDNRVSRHGSSDRLCPDLAEPTCHCDRDVCRNDCSNPARNQWPQRNGTLASDHFYDGPGPRLDVSCHYNGSEWFRGFDNFDINKRCGGSSERGDDS